MESDVSLYASPRSASHRAELREDDASVSSDFADAVLAGLSRKPRSIPCRFFYDARGSELFEEITKLDEYYPTRTETALLETYGSEIAALAGTGRVLVEFGSGSSRKTSLLLSALEDVPAYIPIDIAAESLQEAA
ncbi:MAG: L-histidine N(alpha)-methyltransferase, partial [Methylibium sp.]